MTRSNLADVAPPPPPAAPSAPVGYAEQLPLAKPARGPVNWRSVLLGLAGTVFICTLAPYNDYALKNTYLIGGTLPFSVVTLLFLFALFVNAPLYRWAPRHAFTSGELAVALAMVLVGCGVPSSGFMRWWPGTLTAPLWLARSNPAYLTLLNSLNLPEWLLPEVSGTGPKDWMNDPVILGFQERWTEDGPFPYLAWARPLLIWGIFLFALFIALLCMVTLVRRQWHENERLPFPIAQIQLALIEQPSPGHFLNQFFRSRSFWAAFAVVFFIRGWNASARYWPRYFPEIPLKYDLSTLFSEAPFKFLQGGYVPRNEIYFVVVAISFFLATPVSFSLWFFFIAMSVYLMAEGTMGGDAGLPGMYDIQTGAAAAFLLTTLWVGRNHWRLVLAQAFRGERPGEPRGRYVPYRFAFWTLVICTVTMIVWLERAGMQWWAAAVIVLMLLATFFVVTRVIAETGFLHGQIYIQLIKPWQWITIYTGVKPVTDTSFYLSAMVHGHHYDFREVMPVFASHGMKVTDQEVFGARDLRQDDQGDRRTGRKIIALMLLSLLVGYPLSAWSMLKTEYTYASSLDSPSPETPLNKWANEGSVNDYMMKTTTNYQAKNYNINWSPVGDATVGFVATGLLGFLRLRFAWWPFHPIGFLMMMTYPVALMWFSVLIGFICKVLIVRFGGARAYLNARPFFIGMIVGEAMAGGFWLVIGLILSSLNLPYRTIQFTPN